MAAEEMAKKEAEDHAKKHGQGAVLRAIREVSAAKRKRDDAGAGAGDGAAAGTGVGAHSKVRPATAAIPGLITARPCLAISWPCIHRSMRSHASLEESDMRDIRGRGRVRRLTNTLGP